MPSRGLDVQYGIVQISELVDLGFKRILDAKQRLGDLRHMWDNRRQLIDITMTVSTPSAECTRARVL